MNNDFNITYETCGIDDVESFYKEKFAHNVSYDIQKNLLYEYNILNLKQMYIYDYIKAKSKVLDFGCGSGIFKILKNLDCYLVGIDMSSKAVKYAKELNHYDEAYSLDIFDSFFDKYKGYFDYIVSSDVFGHIEFKDKDNVIKRLKALLKENGTMIHGIETGDIKYNEMTKEQRRDFAIVDGHIGMESEEKTQKRFKQFFNYVDLYTPYGIVNDLDEIIKQNESYDVSYLDKNLMEYLKKNRSNKFFLDAFNISQYCAHKAYEYNTPKNNFLNLYGFSFLISSDTNITKTTNPYPQSNIQFSPDFYQEELLENKKFRWSKPYSCLYLNNIKSLSLQINSYIPAYTQKEQNISLILNGKKLETFTFNLDKQTISYTLDNLEQEENMILEFYADSNFTPMLFEENSDDNRLLAFNLSIISKECL